MLFCLEKNAKKGYNTIQVYVFPLHIYGRLEYPRPVTDTCVTIKCSSTYFKALRTFIAIFE